MVALRGTVSLQMKAIITIDASLYKRQTFLFPGGTENESPWNVFTKYQDMLPCWHLIGRKGYLLLPGTLRKKNIYISFDNEIESCSAEKFRNKKNMHTCMLHVK